MNYRPIKDEDEGAVRKAAYSLVSSKRWAETIDPYVVLASIMTGAIPAVIVNETYLVVYVVGSPWYTYKRVLEEQVVIRIYPGPGILNEVVTALEDIAAKSNCIGVSVGTALADNDVALCRLYERRGFQTECISLYKPLTQG